jgi:hypothetical protein
LPVQRGGVRLPPRRMRLCLLAAANPLISVGGVTQTQILGGTNMPKAMWSGLVAARALRICWCRTVAFSFEPNCLTMMSSTFFVPRMMNRISSRKNHSLSIDRRNDVTRPVKLESISTDVF